jgi:hypothetical protein
VDYVDHGERLRCWTRGRFHDTINIDKSVVDNYSGTTAEDSTG